MEAHRLEEVLVKDLGTAWVQLCAAAAARQGQSLTQEFPLYTISHRFHFLAATRGQGDILDF